MTVTTTPLTRPEGLSLQAALGGLEAVLLAPVIAGELAGWAGSIQEALGVLEPAWNEYVSKVQHPQYKEIADNDKDLLTHVEQMNEEDRQLRGAMIVFQRDLREFAERASHIERDENKLATDRQRVEKSGIDLTLRMKKQVLAVATWSQEAIYRDQGVLD